MHRIWKGESENEGWFYVKQALMSKREKPYRHRIYHVHQRGDIYMGDIYMFNEPLENVGEIEKVQMLNCSDLTFNEGCTVYLKKREESYLKRRQKNACSITFRGASFSTSEVIIKSKMIYS